MAKTKAVPVPVANAMDLIWNDGVVPAWLLGMTLGFVLLFPILKALFPKTCRKRGAFLLAFELVAAVPVRTHVFRARIDHGWTRVAVSRRDVRRTNAAGGLLLSRFHLDANTVDSEQTNTNHRTVRLLDR